MTAHSTLPAGHMQETDCPAPLDIVKTHTEQFKDLKTTVDSINISVAGIRPWQTALIWVMGFVVLALTSIVGLGAWRANGIDQRQRELAASMVQLATQVAEIQKNQTVVLSAGSPTAIEARALAEDAKGRVDLLQKVFEGQNQLFTYKLDTLTKGQDDIKLAMRDQAQRQTSK